MIKAPLICFLCLLASAAALQAQAVATDDAVKEAVRREANTILLRQKLAEAQSAQERNELANATKLYEVCWKLIEGIGAGVESETGQVVSGLTTARMELAQQAGRRGDYQEAKRQIDGVLRVDPKNEEALVLQRQNNKDLAAQAGRVPNQEIIDQLPLINSNKVHAATLVQDGRILFEAGKLDAAEAKLNLALKEDPANFGADYYLNLIREKRYGKLAREREKTSKDKLVEVEQAWDKPVQRELLNVPNPYARANLINTSKGRQAILSKLDKIRLDEVLYDGLPLGEVVKTLNIEAKKRDPDKRGINFIINPHTEASFTPSATGIPGAAAPIDPTTGLPATAPAVSAGEQVDMNAIAIKINPAITDVRLADVLDAIIKVAEKPIKYSIEDYAVVFSSKTPEAAPLYTRFFKVNPNTFYQGLESVASISFGNIQTSSGSGGGGGGGGGGGTGGGAGGSGSGGTLIPRVFVAGGSSGQGGVGGGGGAASGGISGSALGGGTAAGPGGTTTGGATGGGGLNFVTRQSQVEIVQATVRTFFRACGVELDPPKNVFFNDRSGMLMVRGTLQDLDIVEQAVQTLNTDPPQVTIEAKFVEITQDDSRALGFEWFLGNTLINHGAMGLQGGTAPSFQGSPSSANPSGEFPGNAAAGTTIPSSATDQLITSGLRNSANAPTVATFTGILTDPQFRVAIHALEQRQGVDLLNAPKVTTMSGRQCQIQVVDIRTIVTGTSANQTSSGTSTGTGGVTVGGTGGGVGSTIQPTTEALPFGPVLDVVPYVSADGYSIQMTIIPTLTEFLGYDDPGAFVVQAQGVGAGNQPLTGQLPLPHFRNRQVVTSANVWDGQTIVLGGLIAEDVTKIKDKVPVLGDLPLFGRFFRSESSETKKRNLMIFVTPTIIDPSGNRFHSDDEMPFGQNSFPTQPK